MPAVSCPLASKSLSIAPVMLILAVGCQHHLAAPGQPEDSREDRTTQTTIWSDRFEIFLEHKSIVAGTATTFVTHVSDLATLEPRREGALRYLLECGSEKPLEHVDPAPARPGIYTPQLVFPRAGIWTVKLHFPGQESDNTVELGPVTVHESLEAARKAAIPAPPEGITFLKEQQWKLKTRTEPLQKRRLVERLRAPGRVISRPGSRALVTPPFAGRLLPPAGGKLATLGEHVEAGQTLALIQPPYSELLAKRVEADAEVIRTQLDVELAELHYSRTDKLAAQQLRTPREREEADHGLRAARARHEAARSLQAAHEKAGALFKIAGMSPTDTQGFPALELKAPIAGILTQVNAAPGEYVAADRAIATILDTEWVFLEARVSEADLDRVVFPGAATYELPHARGEFHPILANGAGRVVYFGSEVDPVTRTVPLVYEVKNSLGRLRVGLALNLYLETARSEEALAIPETAVIDEEGRPVAFVQLSGETFDKRHITVGLRESGFVEVRSGLALGERVVTGGAYAVRLSSMSAAIPAHGHAH